MDHTSGPPCALRMDRTIVCWNPGGEPELDVLTQPPEGEFTDIAVGAYHACAIRVDGAVACWGENSNRPDPLHAKPVPAGLMLVSFARAPTPRTASRPPLIA